MLIHEMGHAFNATADLSAYTGTVEGKLAWCIRREAESATFAFRVASEMHAQSEFTTPIVLGPPLYKQDMYSKMAAAVAGLTPNGFQYEAALMSFATQVYGADPKYKQFCMDWINKGGLPPAYLPPIDMNPGGSAGGGGGGGGGGSGSPRVPGGYWQEPDPNDIPQHPSNLTDNAPATSVIDMSFLTDSQSVDSLVKQLSSAAGSAETSADAASAITSAALSAALAIAGNQTNAASEDADFVGTLEAETHIRIVGMHSSGDLHTHPTY